MEKLLSTTKKEGGNYAGSLTAQAQKIFPLAVAATKIFFAYTQAKNFFNQPYSG
jgi:hypothetical protein